MKYDEKIVCVISNEYTLNITYFKIIKASKRISQNPFKNVTRIKRKVLPWMYAVTSITLMLEGKTVRMSPMVNGAFTTTDYLTMKTRFSLHRCRKKEKKIVRRKTENKVQ